MEVHENNSLDAGSCLDMKYYGCNRSMVVTNNCFTKNAKALAEVNSTWLVDRNQLADWIINFQTGDK
jgi:HJR/Mrr/RecB family endonuclease